MLEVNLVGIGSLSGIVPAGLDIFNSIFNSSLRKGSTS